ncbi:MAG: hypothetical protein NVS9B15_16760 [Acidobacteriaceae bacterium]
MRLKTLPALLVWLAGTFVGQQAGTAPAKTVVFDRATVEKALQSLMPNSNSVHGGLLVEGDHYKVIPLMRDSAGEVEVHAKDTDVFYIMAGDATFVTGGTVVAAKQTSSEETRGTSIDGGESHQLHTGDVVLIPNGEPHWFQKVSPGFRYLVVKAR